MMQYKITFRVLPFNRQYCEKIVKYYNLIQSCLSDISDFNIRPKTLFKLQEYTPSNDFLGFLIGDDNFRDNILSQKMKITKLTFLKHLGTFCMNYFKCPFRYGECRN